LLKVKGVLGQGDDVFSFDNRPFITNRPLLTIVLPFATHPSTYIATPNKIVILSEALRISIA
jgi:hypothetical protein